MSELINHVNVEVIIENIITVHARLLPHTQVTNLLPCVDTILALGD